MALKIMPPLFALLMLLPLAARAGDTLCPTLEEARDNMPGDVAGVQADIDRLNLCVERAKLLKQLDDIAKQRADTLKKITDPNAGAGNGVLSTGLGGTPLGGTPLGGIPMMPMTSLPALPAAMRDELKSDAGKVKSAGAQPLDNDAAPRAAGWKLRKIWGQGAGMRAQLAGNDGVLLNVVKGDPLPDGAAVETLSVKGVTISHNGKITDLPWDDMSSTNPGTKSGKDAAAFHP